MKYTISQPDYTNPKKQKSFDPFVWVIALALCLCQLCYANPIALDFSSHGLSAEKGDGFILRIISIVGIDLLIDLSVLVVGFIMIRRAHHLKTLKFIIYLPIVVFGGLAIDEFSLYIKDALSIYPLHTFAMTLFLLFVFNYFLCWMFFSFQIIELGIIALLMGFLTHPSVYSTISPWGIFGVLLLLFLCSLKQKTYTPETDTYTFQAYKPQKSPKTKIDPRCSAKEIGKIVLELSSLAVEPESIQTKGKIIQLGRKLDFLPKISLNSNLVYAFRTILEFLGEKDAQKIANVWEENGWDVRKWMAEDLYLF